MAKGHYTNRRNMQRLLQLSKSGNSNTEQKLGPLHWSTPHQASWMIMAKQPTVPTSVCPSLFLVRHLCDLNRKLSDRSFVFVCVCVCLRVCVFCLFSCFFFLVITKQAPYGNKCGAQKHTHLFKISSEHQSDQVKLKLDAS